MIDWIETFAGATRARLIALLRRSRRTINELAGAVGISDNAVRTHLASLQRDGVVEPAGVRRDTGGKPAQVYDLTREAEELFPKAYATVLEGLLSEIERSQGREAVLELLRAVGRRSGSAAEGTLEARVEAAAAALRGLGADLEVERDGAGWILRGYGCPLSSVVERRPDACALVQALVGAIVERDAVECCDRSGRPRCAFRVPGRESAPATGTPG